MTALTAGVLNADAKSGCLWLTSGDVAFELLLGEDHRIDFGASPAVVYRSERRVAAVGDRVDVGGGFLAPEHDGVLGCPVAAGPYLGRLGADS